MSARTTTIVIHHSDSPVQRTVTGNDGGVERVTFSPAPGADPDQVRQLLRTVAPLVVSIDEDSGGVTFTPTPGADPEQVRQLLQRIAHMPINGDGHLDRVAGTALAALGLGDGERTHLNGNGNSGRGVAPEPGDDDDGGPEGTTTTATAPAALFQTPTAAERETRPIAINRSAIPDGGPKTGVTWKRVVDCWERAEGNMSDTARRLTISRHYATNWINELRRMGVLPTTEAV